MNELTDDISQLSIIKQSKTYEIKHSPTVLTKSSSFIVEQNLSNSSTCSMLSDPKSLPEKTRINRRAKPSRSTKSTPSAILIENIKHQHKFSHNNNHSSLKSNQSIVSNYHMNDNTKKKSKCCYCCCCFTPLNNWYENKNKQICSCTPNHSLINDDDDDDDDKLSSNEINTRTPMITSSINLQNSNQKQIQTTTHPSNDVNRRERIRFMKEQKTAKILAVVVGGFILFWLPFFIMYIIPPEIYSFNAQTSTLITWLGYFNSVINPFIYAYCSKQFRMAFWNITFGICIKKSNNLLPISMKPKQVHRRIITT